MQIFMGHKTAEAAQTKSVRLRMLLPHMVDESGAIIVAYREKCKLLYRDCPKLLQLSAIYGQLRVRRYTLEVH